jgi:hypothetical protein
VRWRTQWKRLNLKLKAKIIFIYILDSAPQILGTKIEKNVIIILEGRGAVPSEICLGMTPYIRIHLAQFVFVVNFII